METSTRSPGNLRGPGDSRRGRWAWDRPLGPYWAPSSGSVLGWLWLQDGCSQQVGKEREIEAQAPVPETPERQEGLKGPTGKGLLGSGQEEGASGRRRGLEEIPVPLLSGSGPMCAPAPPSPLPMPLAPRPPPQLQTPAPAPSPGPLSQALRCGRPWPFRHRTPATCSQGCGTSPSGPRVRGLEPCPPTAFSPHPSPRSLSLSP